MLVTDVKGLAGHAGMRLGTTEWREMMQDRVDLFADATDDHYYIHTDPERAAQGRFGTTIAHGYLTLSLVVPAINELLTVEGVATSVNYGLERVRFPAPVPVGSRVRGRFDVVSVDEAEWGAQVTMTATIERDGGDKPVCVAEVVFRQYR
jgi:acyl dehydratase